MRDRTLLFSIVTACFVHALALFANFGLSRQSIAGEAPSIEVKLLGPVGPAYSVGSAGGIVSPAGDNVKSPEVLKPRSQKSVTARPQPLAKTAPAQLPKPYAAPEIEDRETPVESGVTITPPIMVSPLVGQDSEPGSSSSGDKFNKTISTSGNGASGGNGAFGEGIGPGGVSGGIGGEGGGGVHEMAGRYRPAYGYNPKPDYPRAARQAGQQGTVTLLVEVLTSGRTGKITVEHSSGHKLLDDAAVDAVRKWRFVPAKKGVIPAPGWVKIPIEFNLKD